MKGGKEGMQTPLWPGWRVQPESVEDMLPKAEVLKAPKPAAWCTVVRTIPLQNLKAHGHQHPESTASGLQDLASSPKWPGGGCA